MSEAQDELVRAVARYYGTPESRLGYRFVLHGTKHFGYYPAGARHLSMAAAQHLMEDKLGEALGLPANSLVLDAGCGEGKVAARLAGRFGLRVEGVDILDFNISSAIRNAERRGLDNRLNFRVNDYSHLDFSDGTFAGVYTVETLVHAADHMQALREFRRVLKSGGVLVLLEYSVPADADLTPAERDTLTVVNEGSAMHSASKFVHDTFPDMLREAGFEGVTVEDITERVVPMAKRLAQLCYVPYQLGRLLGGRRVFINATAGVELYRIRKSLRYNIVTATKP
jgi:sterol 24-C-methyltransferase